MWKTLLSSPGVRAGAPRSPEGAPAGSAGCCSRCSGRAARASTGRRHFGDERRNRRKRDHRCGRGRWSVIVGGGLSSVVSGGEVVAGEGELVVADASAVVGGAVGRATVDDDDESSSPLHAARSVKLSPHASRSRAGRTKDRAVTMSWVLPVPPTGPARASCPPPERAQGGAASAPATPEQTEHRTEEHRHEHRAERTGADGPGHEPRTAPSLTSPSPVPPCDKAWLTNSGTANRCANDRRPDDGSVERDGGERDGQSHQGGSGCDEAVGDPQRSRVVVRGERCDTGERSHQPRCRGAPIEDDQCGTDHGGDNGR